MMRALFRAVPIPAASPPFDSVHLRVYYEAIYTGTEVENMTGILPADGAKTPWPVVLFLPAINGTPENYTWLGREIVTQGFLFATYTFIEQAIPTVEPGLSPGLDTRLLSKSNYGSGPGAITVGPILKELEAMNARGPLAGCLDLDHVILGGHSAGGTIAIQNANPAFFQGIAGSFAYGAHSLGSKMFGFETGSVMPLCSSRPLLLMGGTGDGVIAKSASRYGLSQHASASAPIERTFESLEPNGWSHLVLFEGANHFAIAHPHDATCARGFLDVAPTFDTAATRAALRDVVLDFLAHAARSDVTARVRLASLSSTRPKAIARALVR